MPKTDNATPKGSSIDFTADQYVLHLSEKLEILLGGGGGCGVPFLFTLDISLMVELSS